MRGRARDGFILLAVLGVMAALAALVGTVSVLVRSAVETVRIGSDALKAQALVRAGTELAAYQLFALKRPMERVDGQEVRLDGGRLTLFVTDEAGRIDLNGSDQAVLAGAYRAAGLGALAPDSFAARVVDWRDADETRQPGGAEAADYAAAGADYRPPNQAFRAPSDLRWLAGVTRAHAEALARLVTVHNPDGKVNALSAPPAVLSALPGLSPALVERLMTERRKGPGADVEALKALLQGQRAAVKFEPGPSYRVRIEARPEAGGLHVVEVVLAPSQSPDALYYVLEHTVERRG